MILLELNFHLKKQSKKLFQQLNKQKQIPLQVKHPLKLSSHNRYKQAELPDPTNELYTPIKALSTFNYDWRLKARLVKVYPKRYYKSNKGCLLNVELMDMYGT